MSRDVDVALDRQKIGEHDVSLGSKPEDHGRFGRRAAIKKIGRMSLHAHEAKPKGVNGRHGLSIIVTSKSNFYSPTELVRNQLSKQLDHELKSGPVFAVEELHGRQVADPVNAGLDKKAVLQRIRRFYMFNSYLKDLFNRYWRTPENLSERQRTSAIKTMTSIDATIKAREQLNIGENVNGI